MNPPFNRFGGKRGVASEVWRRFGSPKVYVEPFCGSAAVLLARPDFDGTFSQVETINDADCYVTNVYRAIRQDPHGVLREMDWPVNELDQYARQTVLVDRAQYLEELLARSPESCDVKLAAWWVWGNQSWIGSGWCQKNKSGTVRRQLPLLNSSKTFGQPAIEYMDALAARLRRVRVACGDWKRVLGNSCITTSGNNYVGVFLDPPYKTGNDLYRKSQAGISSEVREWAIANASERVRIALCGYHGEHDMPSGWEVFEWKTNGGYSKNKSDRERERVWFSPHCIKCTEQPALLPW